MSPPPGKAPVNLEELRDQILKMTHANRLMLCASLMELQGETCHEFVRPVLQTVLDELAALKLLGGK